MVCEHWVTAHERIISLYIYTQYHTYIMLCYVMIWYDMIIYTIYIYVIAAPKPYREHLHFHATYTFQCVSNEGFSCPKKQSRCCCLAANHGSGAFGGIQGALSLGRTRWSQRGARNWRSMATDGSEMGQTSPQGSPPMSPGGMQQIDGGELARRILQAAEAAAVQPKLFNFSNSKLRMVGVRLRSQLTGSSCCQSPTSLTQRTTTRR